MERNYAMADTFMRIFGYQRVSPTDEEIEKCYQEENAIRVKEEAKLRKRNLKRGKKSTKQKTSV